MDYYYYNGELYHHGIAGQKWGVQNGPPYPLDSGVSKSNAKRKFDTGKLASKVKSAASSAKNKISSKVNQAKEKNENKKQSNKKKDISKMSDEELKQVVSRLDLENKYYAYTAKISSATKSKASKFVEDARDKAFSTAIDVGVTKLKNVLTDKLDVSGEKEKKAQQEAASAQKAAAEKKAAKSAAKAEAKAAKSEAKAAKTNKKVSDYTTESLEGAKYRYTGETAKAPSKASSFPLASTKTTSTRFTTNLTSAERAQVNEMRKQTYSNVSSSYASEGKNYVEVVDFSDLYKKKK